MIPPDVSAYQVKETFRFRAKMFSSLRRMLDDKGFLEIEVSSRPTLTDSSGALSQTTPSASRTVYL